MEPCLHLLPQMCNSFHCGTVFPWGDLNPLSLMRKCWTGRVRGHLCGQDMPARGAGIAGVRESLSRVPGKGKFSKRLGHGVSGCAVNPFAFAWKCLLGGFFRGVSCIYCVWEAGAKAGGQRGGFPTWLRRSLWWLSAQKCPLLRGEGSSSCPVPGQAIPRFSWKMPYLCI